MNKCNHEWQLQENYLVCKHCFKKKLKLNQINNDILQGIRTDGKKYSVRVDKMRYFYPEEWNKFYDMLSSKNQLLFLFLITTGARIEEALLFNKVGLIDDSKKSIKLFATKRKARVEGEQQGKPRSFKISKKLYNLLKNTPTNFGFFFINPGGDYHLNNKEDRLKLKKMTKSKSNVTYQNMRKALIRAGIKDPHNFGLHTIRKTHGMWLKTLGVDISEIIHRLGHDVDTYHKHYGSPSIFDKKDKINMIKILGEIYDYQ